MIQHCPLVLQCVLMSPSETASSKVRQAVFTHTLVSHKRLILKDISVIVLKRRASLDCCYVFFVSGFNMMEAFGLTQRAHSSVEGVAAEPFVFNTLPTYTVYKDVQLTQSTKWDTLYFTDSLTLIQPLLVLLFKFIFIHQYS